MLISGGSHAEISRALGSLTTRFLLISVALEGRLDVQIVYSQLQRLIRLFLRSTFCERVLVYNGPVSISLFALYLTIFDLTQVLSVASIIFAQVLPHILIVIVIGNLGQLLLMVLLILYPILQILLILMNFLLLLSTFFLFFDVWLVFLETRVSGRLSLFASTRLGDGTARGVQI